MGALTTLALTTVAAGMSVMGGIQAKNAADDQADAALAQADARARENARLSEREADMASSEADRARRAQKIAFLNSGVDLAGSPLLVMEETRSRGVRNANEVREAGAASGRAIFTEGRMQASSLQSAGQQAFTSGVASGLGTLSGGIGDYRNSTKKSEQ